LKSASKRILWVICILIACLSSALFIFIRYSTAGTPSPVPDQAIPIEYSSGTVQLAVLGDIGHAEGGRRIITLGKSLYALYRGKRIKDGILLLGDNLSAQENDAKNLPKIAKEQFEKPFKPLLEEGISFYAILGNHDNDYGLEPFELNYPLFHLQGSYYYTKVFGKGLVEVFFLYSRDLRENPQKHLAWLEEKLRQSSAPWKIALLHHPIYTTALTHRSSKVLANSLEPLFKKYGVCMVFQGHNHVYEHLEPIGGVEYFTVGSSGKVEKGDLSSKGPKRLGGNDRTNVFLILEFTKDKRLFTAYDNKGAIMDQGIIPRPK